MKRAKKILIIDDEAGIRRLLKSSLEANGYQVMEAKTGAEALQKVAHFEPDLVILDLGLPDMGGAEVLSAIRARNRVPVMVLSVLSTQEDKVTLLDAGADDYVTKPFGVAELLARLRVLERNGARQEEPVLKTGGLKLDFEARVVTLHGKELRLTSTEYDFLRVLAMNAGKVVTQSRILKEVWGPNAKQTHYLRIYAAMVRKKLKEDPANPRWIITEPGVGYRLKV